MAPAALSAFNSHVRFIPLSYDPADSQTSALKLIHTIAPQWAADASNVEFVRFTDGITNTLLKAINRRPGLSKEEVDRNAILLRAYGNGTDILIDREREAANHELLMKHNLAPALLARFANGMLYRFIPGAVAQPKDLPEPVLSKAIARRLAQWHATVPCLPDPSSRKNTVNDATSMARIANAAPGKPLPNLWSTMQKWILALPSDTDAEQERQARLQSELELLVKQLSQRPGFGQDGVSDSFQVSV
jgi:ethanolamine kinase